MTVPLPRPPVVLSIAGSDPSGGAGIQADLKTASALGAYGTCVITALTAQSTRGVTLVHEVPVDVVRAQVDTLVADVAIDVVKVGMLASSELVEAVHAALDSGPLADVPVVLDPVMVATSGSRLLADDAVAAVRELVARADVITPNVPEAAVLLEEEPATSREGLITQAQRLAGAGSRRVLLKGGHLEGPESVDVWLDAADGDMVELRSPRIATTATHGTGCTLSTAIAALRPRHDGWLPAVREAKDWLTDALRHGEDLAVGAGAGPVHHFHEQPRWGAVSG
ncbi:bifunctional hydroxymethylpyrimidine kinase/phosphomethylpyrimidine kinase [Janibacter cremeus]|uniref:bifunctional hydroxymethylpyrimidine kinase/phosphomethylpyrimidine kinase n=1 Tax=Janibacter cremeus TaxID=1285192 RepID=UPI0023F7F2E1|nr:bifunctional hydroxymethylpyrimidine kinase/phosphomethylpyrimidine kinase [Janibacter cremeus]WEV78054.1 bifunctional hydroxymethylpyrimidine kinase/phosphomethylpyrimidine kinase [Janibacter cremeus]